MFTFPPELAPLLIYLVTNGLKDLFPSIDGRASMWAAAFVGAFLFFGEAVIGSLGGDAAEIAMAVSNLVIVILGAFGTHKAVKVHLGGTAVKQ